MECRANLEKIGVSFILGTGDGSAHFALSLFVRDKGKGGNGDWETGRQRDMGKWRNGTKKTRRMLMEQKN